LKVVMSSSAMRDRGPLDFQSVYDEFHPRIRRYLDRMLGGADAEDVTQDVFVKVSQALPGFRRDASLSTWVYRIATNAAYDRLRSPSFHRPAELPIDDEASVEDRSSGVEQTLVRKEMTNCIDGYVARLPAGYRSVLILSERHARRQRRHGQDQAPPRPRAAEEGTRERLQSLPRRAERAGVRAAGAHAHAEAIRLPRLICLFAVGRRPRASSLPGARAIAVGTGLTSSISAASRLRILPGVQQSGHGSVCTRTARALSVCRLRAYAAKETGDRETRCRTCRGGSSSVAGRPGRNAHRAVGHRHRHVVLAGAA
jgi:RNA polymerase sigma factor (sigma-70 family)